MRYGKQKKTPNAERTSFIWIFLQLPESYPGRQQEIQSSHQITNLSDHFLRVGGLDPEADSVSLGPDVDDDSVEKVAADILDVIAVNARSVSILKKIQQTLKNIWVLDKFQGGKKLEQALQNRPNENQSQDWHEVGGMVFDILKLNK